MDFSQELTKGKGRGRPKGSRNKSNQLDTTSHIIPSSHSPLYENDISSGLDFSFVQSPSPDATDLFGLSSHNSHLNLQDEQHLVPIQSTEKKRGRGRPKGSKNKPGSNVAHKSKSTGYQVDEDDEESRSDMEARLRAPAFKRSREHETGMVSIAPAGSLQQHPHQVQLHLNTSASLQRPILAEHIPLHHHFHHMESENSMQHNTSRNSSHALAGDIPVDATVSVLARPLDQSTSHSLQIQHQFLQQVAPSLSPFSLSSPSAPMLPIPSRSSVALPPPPRPPSSTLTLARSQLQCTPISDVTLAYFNRDRNTVPAVLHLQSAAQLLDPPLPSSSRRPSTTPPLRSDSSSSNNTAEGKRKGKEKSHTEPQNESEGLQNLLPKDFLNAMPAVSGPFQLIYTDQGKRKLEGPVPASTLEQYPGPVYVYIANYHPSLTSSLPLSAPCPEPTSPASLKDAEVNPGPTSPKLAKPSSTTSTPTNWFHVPAEETKEKDKKRCPRRCGYCKDVVCKGRGGKAFCTRFRNGLPPLDAQSRDEEEATETEAHTTTSAAHPQPQAQPQPQPQLPLPPSPLPPSHLYHHLDQLQPQSPVGVSYQQQSYQQQLSSHSQYHSQSQPPLRSSCLSLSPSQSLNMDSSYSALANFRGDALLSSMTTSSMNQHLNPNLHFSHDLLHSNHSMFRSLPPLHQNNHCSSIYGLGAESEDVSDVMSLIESITSQAHLSGLTSQHSMFDAFDPGNGMTYDDPTTTNSLGAFTGGLYGDVDSEMVECLMSEVARNDIGNEIPMDQYEVLELKRTERRKPRHCITCGNVECVGKVQRSRCPSYVAEEG